MKLNVFFECSEDDFFQFMYDDIYKEYLKFCIKETLKDESEKKETRVSSKQKEFPRGRRSKKA